MQRRPERRWEARKGFRRLCRGRIGIARFKHGIRSHLVIVIFVVGVRARTLGTIVGNIGVADDKMIHQGVFGKEIFGAVGANVLDHLGTVVAAVSIGGPSERCRPKQAELIAYVTGAGQQISQALRYVGWH